MDQPASATKRSTASVVVWPLIVAAVGGLLYVGALSNGFALDDVPLVRDNPDLRPETPVGDLYLRPYWGAQGAASGLYRPVTILSLRLNRGLSGAGPEGFHAANLLLHAAVCALVWFVARRSGPYYGTAFAAALLFAVHPLHAEAVANIAGRAELLAALFALCSWLCWRRASEAVSTATRVSWSALTGLMFLLALLSKENAVAAPLVFLIDGAVRADGASSRRWRRQLGPAGASAIALAVGLALRAAALGGLRGTQTVAFIDNPAAFLGIWVRLGTAVWVQLKYLLLFGWPLRLSSDYSFDAVPVVESWLDPRLFAGLAWLGGAVALAVVAWRKHSAPLVVGVACWLLFLLPSSNLLFASGTVMAERLAYLPSLGGCLVAGHLAAWAWQLDRRFVGRAVVVALVVASSLFAVRTWQRAPDWKDNGTVAVLDALAQPRSAKLHAGAGISLHARGELEQAESAYRRALEIYPEYAQVRYNLGELLLAQGRRLESIEQLLEAARVAPLNPRPHKTLAPLLEREGRHDEALAAYAAGSRLIPTDLPFRFNYGRLLLSRGRSAEAREVFAELARDDAAGVVGRLGRAFVLEIDGDAAGAATLYRELLGDPGLPGGVRAQVRQMLADLSNAATP